MARRRARTIWLTVLYGALAATALGSSGCLLIAAGAAAGGAVGYAYVQGNVSGTYYASFNDTWAALQTALGELGMPVLSAQDGGDERFIEARTAGGERVRIYVESVLPAESPQTRISVRVATFGDQEVSDRILNQVGAHLVVAPQGAPPHSGVVPAQTAPPPLAETPPPPLPSRPAPAQTLSR